MKRAQLYVGACMKATSLIIVNVVFHFHFDLCCVKVLPGFSCNLDSRIAHQCRCWFEDRAPKMFAGLDWKADKQSSNPHVPRGEALIAFCVCVQSCVGVCACADTAVMCGVDFRCLYLSCGYGCVRACAQMCLGVCCVFGESAGGVCLCGHMTLVCVILVCLVLMHVDFVCPVCLWCEFCCVRVCYPRQISLTDKKDH